MKRIISIVMVLIVILGCTCVAAEQEISVIVNGKKLEFDVPPITVNNRTMVPFRAIFEELGASVEWRDKIITIGASPARAIATTSDRIVEIIDLADMYMSRKNEYALYVMDIKNDIGGYIPIDVLPVIKNGRMLVPIRAISEAMGCEVKWDEVTKTVTINSLNEYSVCITMYAPDGRTRRTPLTEVNEYIKAGWYKEPVQTLYAAGKSAVFPVREVEAQLSVGWYKEPVAEKVVTMYALDGRTQSVLESQVEANKTVGWYIEPVTTMYAADGRTIVIAKREIDAYKAVGWYTEPVKNVVVNTPATNTATNTTAKLTRNDIEITLKPGGSSVIFVNKSNAPYKFSVISINNALIMRPYNKSGDVVVAPGETKLVEWYYDGIFNEKGDNNGLNSYGYVVIEWNGKQYYADFTVNGITTFYRGNARGPVAE